jgi:hypothetical protein
VRGRGGGGGGGWELAVGAMVRFIVSGDEVPGRQKVVARKVVVRRYVGASGRGVGCCGIAHPVGKLRLGSHALLRGRRHRFVEGCVTSCRDAHGLAPFRSHLA